MLGGLPACSESGLSLFQFGGCEENNVYSVLTLVSGNRELNHLFHRLFETQKRPGIQDPRMLPGAQKAPSEGGIWPPFSVSFLILSLVAVLHASEGKGLGLLGGLHVWVSGIFPSTVSEICS